MSTQAADDVAQATFSPALVGKIHVVGLGEFSPKSDITAQEATLLIQFLCR